MTQNENVKAINQVFDRYNNKLLKQSNKIKKFKTKLDSTKNEN